MRVALCQLNARDDRAANLSVARSLVERAAAAGADLAVLPEYTDYLGPSAGLPKPEGLDGEYASMFASLARSLEINILAGSFHETGPDDEHTYNTMPAFDRGGGLIGAYRKIHLYDVEIPGRVSYRESSSVAPGSEVLVVPVDGVQVGLSICYDLRFPELYRRLAIDGATVLVVPAAFMMHTGRDHWEVLLRARAVENQCYVLAAGQIGDHDPGRTCFGRSMVVDPWGTVVAQMPDEVGIITADLDLDRLERIRLEVPSLANRRL
ncbi:carbon-nitrogen hydrolase family protein [Virgisporangium ochraceum]|uniref:Carbon-nitrogen hydrolase n=1 Tax=Virgisporangium ochraceum TaxID=65505 RepID=A0A8J4A6Z0_9ACTN|nr:carbon-nitrogen hydrolase family protein [Virgisporangium ochraceum]GIJ75015.1 carbon-nitrogen hydrolase [Virgisporangium ochraceum]